MGTFTKTKTHRNGKKLITQDEETVYEFLDDPTTTQKALNNFVNDMIVEVKTSSYRHFFGYIKVLLSHPNVTDEMVERLWEDSHYTRPVIAENLPATASTTLFQRLNINVTNGAIVEGFIMNKNTPAVVLDTYVDRAYAETIIRAGLAEHPNTSDELFERLYDEMFSVTVLIAQNPNAPKKLVAKLWNDAVRFNLSENVYQLATAPTGLPEFEVLETKIRVFFHTRQVDKGFYVEDFIPTKKDYITVLKSYYPDVHEGMPEEWIVSLINTLGDEIFFTTEEELRKP